MGFFPQLALERWEFVSHSAVPTDLSPEQVGTLLPHWEPGPIDTDRSETDHRTVSLWEGQQLKLPSSFQLGHKEVCSNQDKDPHLVFWTLR